MHGTTMINVQRAKALPAESFASRNNAVFLFPSGDVVFFPNQDTYIDEKSTRSYPRAILETPGRRRRSLLLLQYRHPNLPDSCGDIISEAGFGIIGCWGEKAKREYSWREAQR